MVAKKRPDKRQRLAAKARQARIAANPHDPMTMRLSCHKLGNAQIVGKPALGNKLYDGRRNKPSKPRNVT